MKTVLVNTDLKRKAILIQSICNLSNKKILILNSEDESRQIEYALGVEDFIVYDFLDVLSGMVDCKKARVNVKDNIYILASSIKPSKYNPTKEDYENFIGKIKDFDLVILTESIFKTDDEIIWSNYKFVTGSNIYQITDSNNKRHSDYKYIGKMEFDNEIELLINTFNKNVPSKIEEILKNYFNDREAKVSFIDRILGR